MGKREEPADDASRPRRLHRNHHYQRPHLRRLPASLPGRQLFSFMCVQWSQLHWLSLCFNAATSARIFPQGLETRERLSASIFLNPHRQ